MPTTPSLPDKTPLRGRERMRSAASWLCALLLIAATGCSSAGGAHWVELKGQRFSVELADDFDERARGLMFRDQMDAETGMLFVHEREQPLAYWMKNTRIPLDILYFDADRRFVSVQAGVPPCSAGSACPNYPARGPSKYVLELNAGRSAGLGLAPGDQITFGPGIPDTGQP